VSEPRGVRRHGTAASGAGGKKTEGVAELPRRGAERAGVYPLPRLPALLLLPVCLSRPVCSPWDEAGFTRGARHQGSARAVVGAGAGAGQAAEEREDGGGCGGRRKLEGTDGMAGWVGTVPTTGLDRFASGQFAPWRDALASFSR
jgi:hypothetical protein